MAVITLSRQFGAGGITIGKMIADELGYAFADSEVLENVAKMANVSTQWVEKLEKEAGGKFSRFISGMVPKSLMDRFLKDERNFDDEEIYLDYLVLIISQLADEGNVVIMGRGSQYILNDHPDAFHILLIDNFENRVNFMKENYNLPESRAMQVVKSEDRRRRSLFQKINKTDYDNPSLYHMVLNMGKVTMDEARELVFEMIQHSNGGGSPE